VTIRALVESERRRLRNTEVAAGALVAAGASALLLGAGAALLAHARWLTLPRALPFAVWAAVACAFAAAALVTRRRLAHRGSAREIAAAIEIEHGLRRGCLVGALEVEGQGALATRAAHAARASLPAGAPLAPRMRRATARHAMAGAALGGLGLLALGAASPLFGDGLRAVLRPLDAWRGSLLALPRLEGVPRELMRGSALVIRVLAPGRTRVFVSHREAGDSWRHDTLAIGADGRSAPWRVPALRADLRVVASDGRAASETASVHAVERPFVGGLTLRVDYPAYLAHVPETVSTDAPLRLPRGSILSLAGRASVPLSRVWLASAMASPIELASTGQTFTGRFVATRSVRLEWHATSSSGRVPDLPPPLELEVLADSAPRVVIVAPVGDTILASDDAAVLDIAAHDDHGLALVVLRRWRAGAVDETASVQQIAGMTGPAWTGTVALDVASLRLQPGESMRVRAEAVDASPWAQRGVSRELVIRRPTGEERRAAVRALGDSAVRDARTLAADQRALGQRTDEAARAQARETSSGRTGASAPGAPALGAPAPGMSYERAAQARGLAQEQRAMAERVQKLRESTEQLARQLKAAGALDSALARQLGEAQALLRQALTPELMAQMQALEGAARQQDGEQSRNALRDLARLQQRMRAQLEQSAEMLQRAAREGAMQTLGDQAAELAQRARSLSDSSAVPSTARGARARESAAVAEQAKRLRDQMDGLADQLKQDRASAGAARTEQAGEHAGDGARAMQRFATEQRSDGSASRAGDARAGAARAEEAARELEASASAMRDARSAQVKEWKQELTSTLDQSVQELLQLARQERALDQQTRGGAPGGDGRGAQSAVAQGVDQASQRLQVEGKKSALLSSRSQRAMSDARDRVAQATQAMARPKAGGASGEQSASLQEAADALTRAAASLARDRERANAAGSASGFSEMLQEMQEAARRQGQINGQAQSLLSMPGGAGGAQGQALARSLARQQRGVADKLEEAGDATGGDQAAQLAREARQLADRLDGGRPDAATLARQQQLFRRLLDAGHSLEKEERDDAGRREAQSATGDARFVPVAAADAKAAVRFRPPTWDELRGLSADERRGILDYFSRINSAPPR
jgi:hypothetical protein